MAARRLLTLDFETFYEKGAYSLRGMSTPAYIFDDRFQVTICGFKVNNEPTVVVEGPDVPYFLAQHPPELTATVTFNSLFDNSILAWHYGYVPSKMIDGMGMARALRGHLLNKGASLQAVAKVLGIGHKDKAPLDNVSGLRFEQIKSNPTLLAQYKYYCHEDVELLYRAVKKLTPEFPDSEQRLLDMVLRACVVPRFRLDVPMLTKHLFDLRVTKEEMLLNCGVLKPDLMSTAKFASLLEGLGVVVQYKVSPTTHKEIPALAKSDDFMKELQEHPDERVQALAAARLGHKSTIEETRCQKLIEIASLPWHHYRDGNPRFYMGGGTMPVPLRYGGAHTHRLSGEWGMNMQNLPSSRKKDANGEDLSRLRKALRANEGYKVVVGDLSQIEARMVAWLAGCAPLREQFATKQDPYAKMGGYIFGYEVDPKVHKLERFIGKTAILGLGYGCGAAKFYRMVIVLARALGIDLGEMWSEQMAQKAVDTYRDAYSEIRAAWRTLDRLITMSLINGNRTQFGPVTFGRECVALPNEMKLHYHEIRKEEEGEIVYRHGKTVHKLYGAKLMENVSQALARIVVMNAALRVAGRFKEHFGHALYSHFVLQAHDELAYIVPEKDVDFCKSVLYEELIRCPSWAKTLPLDAEVNSGQTYGDAK